MIFERASNEQNWFTPPPLIEQLGPFDLDPCSPVERVFDTARVHYSRRENGLIQKWFGRVWLNPPYKELRTWLKKMSGHRVGIGLTFNRSDTEAFQRFVFPFADSLFFIEGRLRFYNSQGERGGRAPAPSVLIGYTEEDSEKIAEMNYIGGQHVRLSPLLIGIFESREKKSWRVIVGQVMEEISREASLEEIYQRVLKLSPGRVRVNKHWRAKVRQTLQVHHKNVRRGIWEI